jgi:hypothetical protein
LAIIRPELSTIMVRRSRPQETWASLCRPVNDYAYWRRPLSGMSTQLGGNAAAEAPGLVIADRYHENIAVDVHDNLLASVKWRLVQV